MDTSSLSEELLQALGRMPGEKSRAWNALIDYAQMEQRSLAGLVKRYQTETEPRPTKRIATIKDWSTRFNWQARVAQFDLAMADRKVQVWAERKEQLNELAWEQGLLLRARTMSQKHDNAGELRLVIASWAEVDKVQRLAVDAPTDNINMKSGAALDAEIEQNVRRLGYVRKASTALAAEASADAE